ncbi:neuralized-like protein 4 isoform X2 [Mytilus galloprovincialis]|uniref:neuralized-like protein 4 isoform X2 n=1 Tax=Mytilus galloprovincialis TaxID=29158 RepID=UPI003F7CCA19
MWKFHRICGENISLENNCTTAKRLNPTETIDQGFCFTNTPLVNGKVYEIQVDELVTKWSSSLILGVTTNIPSDLTGIHWGVKLKESWMLHRSTLYKNEERIGAYSLNLYKVQVGDKLGIMKASDSTLHFHLNGIDHGKAFSNLPQVVYGVVDLAGKCCHVSIINKDCESRGSTENRVELATEAGAQVAIKKTHSFSGRPADWNVDAVCEFITSIPDCSPYAEKFRSEHIDGASLIELDKKDLKEFFDMPLGLAVKICSQLKKLEGKK